MKTLLVTVGTSAITNRDIGKVKPPAVRQDNRRLQSDAERYLLQPEARKGADVNASLRDDLIAGHTAFWESDEGYQNDKSTDGKRYRNLKHTSAELFSCNLIAGSLGAGWKPENCLLLTSATQEGRFAALLNERIMQDQWGWRVETREIAGLNERVDGAVYGRLETVFDECSAGETAINITGGFKGVMPYVSSLGFSRNFRLYYFHEDATNIAEINSPPSGVGPLLTRSLETKITRCRSTATL